MRVGTLVGVGVERAVGIVTIEGVGLNFLPTLNPTNSEAMIARKTINVNVFFGISVICIIPHATIGCSFISGNFLGSDPLRIGLVEVARFFMLSVFLAVFAILIHVQLFRRIDFIALCDVVSRFAHGADESDE